MRTEILAEAGREATAALPPQRVAEAARRQLDVRLRTITTAVAWAAHEQFATLEVGDEIEQRFRVDPDRLAFGGVVVCEYLTFMEVMQQADVQLYA